MVKPRSAGRIQPTSIQQWFRIITKAQPFCSWFASAPYAYRIRIVDIIIVSFARPSVPARYRLVASSALGRSTLETCFCGAPERQRYG